VRAAAQALSKVFFDYDSASLDSGTKSALDQVASIMSQNPSVKLEIQGHCDERGTTSYNMSLGERRARAVNSYLSGKGVPTSRLATVSYGEERPSSSGAYETAWAQNRRAEFRVTYQDDAANVQGSTNR